MNDITKYYKNKNIQKNITINVSKHIENYDVKVFIKTYKISKYLKGKFFIKNLIKRIFKYKINYQIKWDSLFWDNIKISKIEIEISFKPKFISLDKYKCHIEKNTKKNRLSDIYKYMDLINKGTNLSCPLYITGECLNYLGADIDNNELFLLDGSRRITANLLLNINKIEAFLISKYS